jgi:hypothetical protein
MLQSVKAHRVTRLLVAAITSGALAALGASQVFAHIRQP